MTDLPVDMDDLDDPLAEVTDDYGSPDVVAVVAIVLAVASLCGFGLLNGSYYFLQYAAGEPNKSRLVLSTLLGAAFALVPVWLGWRTSARLLETDDRWIATAARAAVVIGLLSLVLRLVLAVLAAGADAPTSFGRF